MASKEFYRMDAKEALEYLDSSEKGLSRKEADKRRKEYGPNSITTDIMIPKWLIFLRQFKDLLVIVLIAAGIISYSIGSYRDATVMFIIVFINAVIGFIQEYKAGKILESLQELIRSPAKIRINGELQQVSQDLLVPGDIIVIEAGDKIPSDARILEAFNLRTNEFSLTGESTSQEKTSKFIKEECVLADRDNMVYMGTTAATGTALALVVGTGMNTEMGKIASMTSETTGVRSPLQKELGMLAKWLTSIVIVISIALFGIALWQGFSFFMSMVYALGVAVAAVPQALPAQVTVALSATSRRLADRYAVVKNLPSVETLGSTTVICTDKTGTLTKNEMTVTKVWFSGREYELTGIGYAPEGGILDEDGKALSQEQLDEIELMMDAATMSSNAEIHAPDDEHSGWYAIGDPTEAALITMSTKLGTRSKNEDEESPELQEFPFDSERKLMSSVRQIEGRMELALKGATDSVIAISRSIYKDGKIQPITGEDKEEIRRLNDNYSKDALRVLAIAFRPLESNGRDYTIEEAEKDVVFLGLVCMIDPPKEGVREAVASCHDAQIRIIIMTGDHAITAQAVGRQIGLSSKGDPPVYTGSQMEKMTDPELTEVLYASDSVIFSRVAPEDKLRIVKLLQARKEVVAVTGDGVNDAPALKRAAIGVAMGKTGTDVAKEAAQLILLDDSFPTLVEAVREGRTIYNNLKKTVIASMTTNVAELVVVLLGLLGVALWNWAIPILAIQILAIDLLAEVMPLTFLTFDPPPPGIMKEPPRDLNAHIMNISSSIEVLILGSLIGVLAFGNFAFFLFRTGIELTPDSMGTFNFARATTLTYITVAFCQFVNILSRRYEFVTVFNRNILENRILLGSIIGSMVLIYLGINVPIISSFLYFSPPGSADLFYGLASAGFFLIVFELLKAFKRSRTDLER